MTANSQHWQIAEALVNHFKAVVPNASERVFNGRTRPIGQETEAAIVLRGSVSVPVSPASLGGRTTWRYQCKVECYARSTESADQIAVQVVSAINTAGGLHPNITDICLTDNADGLAWDYEQIDQTLVCITVKIDIRHETLLGEI